MKQINNGYRDCYFLTEEGKVFNSQSNQYLKPSKDYIYSLITKEGKRKKIAIKTLYRLVYDKEWCIDTIQDLKGEEWREIVDSQGRYYISNLGRVKSYQDNNARILQYNMSTGYPRVDLMLNGTRTTCLVSRLVVFHFYHLPLSKDKREYDVHHINGNKLDNSAENLVLLPKSKHIALHNQLKNQKI